MPVKKRTFRAAVILGGLAVFVLLMLGLSRRGPLFARTYLFKARFESVSGLERQSRVLMRGFPVGQVRGVDFEPGGVAVTMEIGREFAVPAGSTAAVESFNLLGERVINITPAGSGPALPPGSVLPGSNEDILAQVRSALDAIGKTGRGWDGKRLEKTLDLVDETLGALRTELGRSNFGRAASELGQAAKAVAEMRDAILKSSETFGTLSEENRAAMARLDQALEAAGKTQASLDRYLGRLEAQGNSAANLMNDTQFIADFKGVLSQLNDFLKDIKKNPKKYFRFSLF